MSEARLRTPKLTSSMPDARALRLSAEDGYLLSCVDGQTTESDLALVTGRPLDEIRASLSKFETLGLIVIEETAATQRNTSNSNRPPRVVPERTDGSRPQRRSTRPPPDRLTPAPPRVTANDVGPSDEEVDLDPKLRAELLSVYATLDKLSHYALLGVERSADKQAIKRAYYERAARFHPDRHFRKRLGTFKVRMEAVFSRLTLAVDTLTSSDKRGEYDAYLDEQRRIRGIESELANAAAEARHVQEAVERTVSSEQETPVAPSVIATVVPNPPAATSLDAPPLPRATAPTPEVDPAARREAFARRLLGARSSSYSVPPPLRSGPPPPSIPDAMEALRRRYEERVAAMRAAEAIKYAARGEEAARANEVATAARAFSVAHGLAPHDEELKRKATAARAEAEASLGERYRHQAEYEEKHGQWSDAAGSWAGVCRADPNDASAHQRAANALLKSGGSPTEAVRLASRSCTLASGDLGSRITLIEAYLGTGQGMEARRELEMAASMAPDHERIKELLKKAQTLP